MQFGILHLSTPTAARKHSTISGYHRKATQLNPLYDNYRNFAEGQLTKDSLENEEEIS